MCGWVFICATATRPEASCPEPSPLVWLNHGRCAGAFAWVRTQTLCLPASALIASISSRALLESPPGAGAFIVTAMTFLLMIRALRPFFRVDQYAQPGARYPERVVPAGYGWPGKFAASRFDRGQCPDSLGPRQAALRKSAIARVKPCGWSMFEIWPAPGSST